MKNCLFSIIVLMFLTGLVYPQKMKDKILKNKNKLEQLEKIKLIESLDTVSYTHLTLPTSDLV